MLLLPSLSRAEPPARQRVAGESAEYQRVVRAALDEFEAGNYPEARGLFTQAHQLYPNARTFRGLGFVAFELRNYGESVTYLEAALGATEKPLNDSLRRTTEELLQRARNMIARVHLDVSPHAESILVDDVPVELASGDLLVLQVGDHMIEVKAAGHVPERRMLKIAGGEELRIALVMRPAEPARGPRLAEQPAPAPREDKPRERRWYKSPWLWTAVAVVVVGAGVGTYFAVRKEPEPQPADPTSTANTPPGGVIQLLRSP
jgi:hypothetical protein